MKCWSNQRITYTSWSKTIISYILCKGSIDILNWLKLVCEIKTFEIDIPGRNIIMILPSQFSLKRTYASNHIPFWFEKKDASHKGGGKQKILYELPAERKPRE